MAQLAGFAFAIQLIRRQEGTILLLDEPETSLPPQTQRALVRALRALQCQVLIATHSSNLLDRADPRKVIRCFRRGDGSVVAARPQALSEEDATRFARFSTPQTAEAFFAHAVILVEGESDRLAVEAAAIKVDRNLDSEGVSVVSLEGGGGLGTFLGMLGPKGFSLKLAGLCDTDQEVEWAKRLTDAELGTNLDRHGMEQVGFFVCDVDLECELLRALGEARALAVVDKLGDRAAFEKVANQPQHRQQSLHHQLHAFLATRRRKIAYAPVLVEPLAAEELPRPLLGALNCA